jgi:hypothetical protein
MSELKDNIIMIRWTREDGSDSNIIVVFDDTKLPEWLKEHRVYYLPYSTNIKRGVNDLKHKIANGGIWVGIEGKFKDDNMIDETFYSTNSVRKVELQSQKLYIEKINE